MHETRRGSYTIQKSGPGPPISLNGAGSECTLLSREAAVLCLVHGRSFRNVQGYGSYAECGHYSAFLETPCPYSCCVPKPFPKPPTQLQKDQKC